MGEDQKETHLELTFTFLRRVLFCNAQGNSKLDGIVAMKIIIAIFENLAGQIDHALPTLLGVVLAELKNGIDKKAPKNYISMILQTIAVSFFNNSVLTFQQLEENNMTVTVFQTWMTRMGDFKQEFELRRVIFGLLAILKTPGGAVPPLVAQRMPQLMKAVSELVARVYKDRISSLEENEKYIAKGGAESDSEEGGMDDDSSDGDIEDDENLKEITDKIKKA